MKTESLKDDMIKNGFYDFNLNKNKSYCNKIDYITLLNDNSIDLINEYYKMDFEYFNYEMIITKKKLFNDIDNIICKNIYNIINNNNSVTK